MIRACGPIPADGQTLTIRPRESNASDPHTASGFASEVAIKDLPSGPPRPGYASVIQVSLWMLLFGFGAMNGFWGANVVLLGGSGKAVDALPWKAGSDGGGTGVETIGSAEAVAGTTSTVARAQIAAPKGMREHFLDPPIIDA